MPRDIIPNGVPVDDWDAGGHCAICGAWVPLLYAKRLWQRPQWCYRCLTRTAEGEYDPGRAR